MAGGTVSRKEKELAKAQKAMEAMQKEAEDATWAETDKRIAAREGRQHEKHEKHDAKVAAKLDRKVAEENEQEEIHEKLHAKKVTQAEIARRQALLAATVARPKAAVSKKNIAEMPHLEPNRNRSGSTLEATCLNSALAVLHDVGGGADGGAAKAIGTTTYPEFEKRVLPELREEKPGLKLSQLKEHAMKLWARSDENPARGR